LVKTGKYRQSYFEQSDVKPNVVVESVVEFADKLLDEKFLF